MSNSLNERIVQLQEELRQGRITRRDFMRYATLLGVSLGAAEVLAACAPTPAPTSTPKPPPPPTALPQPTAPPAAVEVSPPSAVTISMAKDWQLMIDYDRCSGCRVCELECAKFHYGVINPALSRVRIFKVYPGIDVSMFCRNCIERPCIDACPTTPKAISRNEETGANLIDPKVCTGCKLCLENCKAQHIDFHPTDNYPLLCDLCGLNPACVAACPEGALSVVPPTMAPDTWAEPLEQVTRELLEKRGMAVYIKEA